MQVLSDCRCRICNPQEGTMRLGLLLMTLAIALGIGAMGLRAAPLAGADGALGAPEAMLEHVGHEICKPLDDANTISVCRPLTEDDDVDEDDDEEDDDE
jgi:hypothetical protein